MKRNLLAIFLASFLSCSVHDAASAEDFQSATKAGLAAMSAQQYDEAEKHFKRAILLTGSGPKYGDYATGLTNLGNLYAQKKQIAQAETSYREALRTYQKAFGENSTESANVNQALGDLFRKSGNCAKAIPLLEKAKVVREKNAKERPEYTETLLSLAECKSKTGKGDDAIALVQDALAIREKLQGRMNGRVIKIRFVLAKLYDDLGRIDSAITTYEQLVKDSSYNEYIACPALERLGTLYSQIGKDEKAESNFKRALALREKRPGPNKSYLKECVKLYSQFLRKQNRTADIKKLEKRVASK